MNLKKGLLAVLLTLLVSLSFAGTTGKLSGRIRGTDGKAIGSAKVVLMQKEKIIVDIQTKDNGNYLIINIQPGEYEIKFQKQGYDERYVSGIIIKASLTTTINATLVKPGELDNFIIISDPIDPYIKKERTIDLNKVSDAKATGKLAGRVKDDVGNKIANANIWIESDSTLVKADKSRENGAYIIINIPPGLYSVKVTYKDYSTVIVDSVGIEVDKTKSLNAQLIRNSTETIRYIYDHPKILHDPIWEDRD